MQIEEHQLDGIEGLLTQSMKGIHLLYDNNTIAQILQKPTEEIEFFTIDNLERIQDLFGQLIERDTLEKKQSFLSSLDPDSFEILLRTYFHILENSIQTVSPPKH